VSERETSEKQGDATAPGAQASASEGASVVRHEEELRVASADAETGALRAHTRVDHEQVHEVVPRSIEHFDDVERTAPYDEDSGEVQILQDGSVSIPILEEELVIEKRMIVRERIVIRKRSETRHEHVETTLRKERVEIDADDVPGRVVDDR
jgi:uncharacterized protein (TIGR02271 family)